MSGAMEVPSMTVRVRQPVDPALVKALPAHPAAPLALDTLVVVPPKDVDPVEVP